MTGTVAVVGALNLDQIVRLTRFPDIGETVMGSGIFERPGGKGGNQAAAAAALCMTSLIAAVGDDEAGLRMVGARRDEGIDVTHVVTVDASSGRAIIEVDEHGDNRIVVIAGANAELTGAQVAGALDDIDPDVVLTQLESPIEVTEACAEWVAGHRRRLVLNPSPVAPLGAAVLSVADPLVINEIEAEFFEPVIGTPRSVVTTRGPRGVIVSDGGVYQQIPVREVAAADTVGAGDVFAGTLAALLAGGADLIEAARVAAETATEHVALNKDVE